MAWIESHQEIARHPKTRRLARLLDISIPTAIGHLHCLWWWALDFADDGDLSRYSAEDIADGALWEGNGQAFADALVTAGFVDEYEERQELHDWDQYAGKLVDRRERNREAMRRARARDRESTQVDMHNTCTTRDEHANTRVKLPYPTVHNSTVPGSTGLATVPSAAVESANVAPEAPPPEPAAAITPIQKPTKGATVGNPRVQALVDGLRAADVEYVVTPQDAKALKLSPGVPIDRVISGIVKITRGEWGDDWFRENLSVPLVIGRINGLGNGRNGRARASPARTSRKADGVGTSEFDAFDDTTSDYAGDTRREAG